MTQVSRGFATKHDVMSSHPQLQTIGVPKYVYSQAPEKQRQEDLWDYLASQSSQVISSKFNGRLRLKT